MYGVIPGHSSEVDSSTTTSQVRFLPAAPKRVIGEWSRGYRSLPSLPLASQTEHMGLGTWAGSRSGTAAGTTRVAAGLGSSVLAAVAVDRQAQGAGTDHGNILSSSEEQDE